MAERWRPASERRRHGHYRGRDTKYGALPILDSGVKTEANIDPEDPNTPTWRKGYFGG
jgi:hypothetical protein